MKNKKGFTLIEVMIVLVIITILSLIAFPSIQRARIESNHVFAKATLSTIGKAFEIYAINNSQYPNSVGLLFSEDYIKKDYFSDEYRGYIYKGNSNSTSYSVIATPINNNTGIESFILKTGVIIK